MRNPYFEKLEKTYLFSEIERRVAAQPTKPISLGIGDTTEPLPAIVADRMAKYAHDLGTKAGYSGYGSSQGSLVLREAISSRIYSNRVSPEEIFLSDGAKCDLGRLQFLFPQNTPVAVQDPAYPVYVDASILAGRPVTRLACTPENDFFPTEWPEKSLIYVCSPNNPTGAAATRTQLTSLVQHARENGSAIIYDAAYSPYIQDTSIPRSIFEIEGAREVAIELSSFSKLAGFTGIRLGWSVVPKGPFHADWNRITGTLFNGASNISQIGGLACLSDGWNEVQANISLYLENARLLRESIEVPTFGGVHAPYIWAQFDRNDWEVFDELLEVGLVATPGSGFGTAGKGFIRFSAFGHRETVKEAQSRLAEFFSGALAR